MTHPEEHSSGLGVCIITWNSAESIGNCLQTVLNQTVRPEAVLLIDNQSTDETVEIARSFAPRVRVIENETNTGFCGAANQGFRTLGGEYFATMNPDVELDPFFFESCLAQLEKNPDVGFVSGKLLRPGTSGRSPLIDSAGLYLGKDRRGGDRGQGEEADSAYNELELVFGSCGAAVVLRRSMLDELSYPGGEVFDESFFCYKEDLDLGWRAQKRGWSCLYVPDAIAMHRRHWRRDRRREIPEWIRVHSLKNRYLMLVKNESARGLLENLFPILWFEIRALVYLILFEPGMWRAYLAAARCFSDAWRKRRWQNGRISHRDRSNRGRDAPLKRNFRMETD